MDHDVDARLRREGLEATTWSNGAGDRYGAHEHAYDKVIVCTRGSIRFGLPGEGTTMELEPGDRLEIPAGTDHDALVGPNGVACLEAHLDPGTIATVQRLRAGGW